MNGEILVAVLVVALASSRLARAIALDSISDPFRAWVYWHAFPREGPPPDGMSLKRLSRHGHTMVAPRVSARAWKWAYGLVSCPFCCGWWISLALFLVWAGLGWENLLYAVACAGAQAAITAWTT